jgi:thiamine biosynthesis lipoprotein
LAPRALSERLERALWAARAGGGRHHHGGRQRRRRHRRLRRAGAWPGLAVRHPRPGGHARIRFAVEPPGAVATSGSYERGPHIYDPFGGGAGDAAASATVTGPELDLADALATALIVAGTPGLELVDRIDATEACLVLADGTLRATRGFPFAT